MAKVKEQDKVQLLNANTGQQPDVRIPQDRYDAMKTDLLAVIPDTEEGVPCNLLSALARPMMPGWWRGAGWSVT